VLATVTIGMFIGVVESAIVGVAYPAIQKDFGSTHEAVQWVTTAFRLTQGVVLPAAVWLYERLGLRRTYLISLALYAVASALCGLSPNLGWLIGARVILAIPAALTPIVCMALIYHLMPAPAVQPLRVALKLAAASSASNVTVSVSRIPPQAAPPVA